MAETWPRITNPGPWLHASTVQSKYSDRVLSAVVPGRQSSCWGAKREQPGGAFARAVVQHPANALGGYDGLAGPMSFCMSLTMSFSSSGSESDGDEEHVSGGGKVVCRSGLGT